jgi:hypothetical protein
MDTIITDACTNIITLDLIVGDTFRIVINEEICEGDTVWVGNNFYTETGTYENELTSSQGCDSTVILNLNTLDIFNIDIVETICQGETYLFDGIPYSATGSYSATFTSSNGCDSIVDLSLTVLQTASHQVSTIICLGDSVNVGNNTYFETGFYMDTLIANNGCDSIHSLDLLVLNNQDTTINATICQGDEFILAGIAYTESGTYSDTVSAADCESIVTLNLDVLDTFLTVLNESICEGETIAVGNSILFIQGQYVFNLTSSNGCDSTVILNLEVNPIYEEDLIVEICEGETIQIGNMIYDASGMYSDTLMTSNGCDSIINLTLNVVDSVTFEFEIELCQGDTIEINGIDYTEAGSHSYVLQSDIFCDTLVNFEIFMLPSYNDSLDITICEGDSIMIGDISYFATGIYVDTLIAENGCDSIINLDLSVEEGIVIDTFISICEGDSVVFNNTAYTEDGDYEIIIPTGTACDSIINLELEVIPTINRTLTDSICAGDTLVWRDQILTEAGSYTDTIQGTECDAVITLNLRILDTFRVFINEVICNGDSVVIGDSVYDSAGTYTTVLNTVNGCDSVIILDLMVNPSPTLTLNDTI